MVDTQQRTYYRPGLIFLSKHAGYQLIVKQPVFHFFPDGQKEERRPIIVADFGRGLTSGSNRLQAENGETYSEFGAFGVENVRQGGIMPDFRGGALDLDATSLELGWTDDEREQVARKMLQLCENPAFNDFTLFEPPPVVAPFPTYDEIHHNRIVPMVKEMGLVAEALYYERTSRKRETVVRALEEALAEQDQAGQVEQALTV